MSTPVALLPASIPEKPKRELVPQPHGGALLKHGNPGNKGGGPLPHVIREAMRRGLKASVPVLRQIARGIDPDTGKKGAVDLQTRLKAMDLLGKYGVGMPTELTGPDGAPFTVTIRAAVDEP